ncbi:BlaI/MecI/CopY family transcriptional regulator [Peristeroidobacter agariperforans]|uniref:BlaI/MecI/CopY family transcriptional regulator n=1 Tax=Peristeroidobacter agariperforans TaxID=268404 RepID=UPI00101D2AE3|nr:BlaI/MecI/CopY family transcriptional regulator [Peristeroidobacter agariperforans]
MKISLGSRESEVMDVLWQRGPSTVNEVLSGLSAKLAYTTVLTILQNLESKKCVRHVAEGRAHRYEAAVKQADLRRTAVRQLTKKLFRGSSELLLAQLVDDHELSKDQLQRIQAILDENRKAGSKRKT